MPPPYPADNAKTHVRKTMTTEDQEKKSQGTSAAADPVLTREEYNALMSSLAAMAAELEYLPSLLRLERRLRRLEFIMIILVGLILLIFMMCRGG
jgi:hypothetical protein